eukprot:GHVU01216052.1.p1 GENE.GHVU01216052.1~~GHVU01216052.1.p1  ORF type:complete len:157 (+),score=9.17 GHVU01216052.1:214-684(+)
MTSHCFAPSSAALFALSGYPVHAWLLVLLLLRLSPADDALVELRGSLCFDTDRLRKEMKMMNEISNRKFEIHEKAMEALRIGMEYMRRDVDILFQRQDEVREPTSRRRINTCGWFGGAADCVCRVAAHPSILVPDIIVINYHYYYIIFSYFFYHII